MAMSFGGDIIN